MSNFLVRQKFISFPNYILYILFICIYVYKAMAPHSSTLAWKIPWTEAPGRLQSMGSLRVGHNWGTSLSLFTFMHWRRGRQDEMAGWHHRLDGRESEWTPGAGDWQGGLASCDSWVRKESDTTELLNWTELNWTEDRLLLSFKALSEEPDHWHNTPLTGIRTPKSNRRKTDAHTVVSTVPKTVSGR